MTEHGSIEGHHGEVAPGDVHEGGAGSIHGYLIGLVLSLGLTFAAFALVHTPLIWGPGIPIALAVLAIAQMGVHLVFFLHIGTGPDNTNNILALAFGILIVILVVAGSVWIMHHLNLNMAPAASMMDMPSQ